MATFYDPMPVAATTFSSDSTTGGSVPTSFDVALFKPYGGDTGHLKLTIVLRVKLRQLPPRVLPVLDADDKPFWTSAWTPAAWQSFVANAEAEANIWNNKFWLQPPATFSQFDRLYDTFPNQAYRPNIRCELLVDFNPAKAYRTIDVANLNTSLLAGKTLDSGTFRSHSVLWDSLDGTPWVFAPASASSPATMHRTIAHEIGHHLGLDHIGVLMKTPLCVFAMAAASAGVDQHPNVNGGTNSFYCYGGNQGAINANIMGAGDKFSVENAKPWLWAMIYLRMRQGVTEPGWKAVLSDPGPGSWVARSK